MVSVFDFIAVAQEANLNQADIVAANSISKFKALRVLRILRLIKLLRLLRMSRIGKRWEAKMAINYGALALFKAFSAVVFGSHLFACLWTLQSDLFHDNRHDTWLGNVYLGGSPLCWPREGADLSELPTDDASVFQGNSLCKGAGQLYVTSIYWAIMTITSIGYGDVMPVQWSEQLVSTIIMLLGSVLWGQVIATFCGVVATFNPEGAEFRRTMDDLNRFCVLQGLEAELRTKLREYFHQTKHLRVASAHRRLLSQMSPALQSKITLMCNEKWLRRVSFLNGAEEGFIIQLALQLTAMVFAPGELAPTGFLYIVHRGVALYGGRVLTGGKVWGDDVILMDDSLRRQWCARAMNYLEVFVISRDELINTAFQFPATLKVIRRAALMLAMRRYLVTAARAIAAKQRPTTTLLGRPTDQIGSAFLGASNATEAELHTAQVAHSLIGQQRAGQRLLEVDAGIDTIFSMRRSSNDEEPSLQKTSGTDLDQLRAEMTAQLSSTRQLFEERMLAASCDMAGLQTQIGAVQQQVERLCAALIKE